MAALSLYDDDSRKEVIGRKTQMDLLFNLLGQDTSVQPNCLFAYGPMGCGKTVSCLFALKQLHVKICHADCVEFYNARVMYETILNQLSGTILSSENGFASYASCDNMNDFMRILRQIATENYGENMAIVLEHAERLRGCAANVLPVLCRIQEFSGVHVTVILMSTLTWDKFHPTMWLMDPILIPFPPYTKDELTQIFVAEKKSEYSDEFYTNYVKLVLSVFFMATKNLPELKHMVEVNFAAYCHPVIIGEATESDVRHLWRNIEPQLKKAMSSVFLREVSSQQFEKMQQLIPSGENLALKTVAHTKMELPYYSKFLLIAAYLASYNPARSDKRFFLKHHGKQRKTQAIIKAKERCSSQLIGPKSFPLDRLLAIFYSVVEEKVAPTANIMSQITSLASLRLLVQMGGEDTLDAPKYKCAVNLDFIKMIARSVNFDIMHYLYEFV